MLLTVPIIISGLLIFNKSYSVLDKRELESAKQRILQLQTKLDTYIQKIESLSFDISFNEDIQNMLINYTNFRFMSMEEEFRIFNRLFGISRLDECSVFYIKLLNTNNQIISIGTLHRENNNFDSSFIDSNKKNVWVGPYKSYTYNTNAEHNIISFYRKIINPYKSQFIGISRIDISETSLRDLYTSDVQLKGVQTFILDENNIIVSSLKDDEVGKNFDELVQNKVRLDKEIDHLSLNVNGTNCMLVYNTLKSNSWKIVILYDILSFNQHGKLLKTYIFVIVILCLIFCIIFSIIVAKIILNPLNQLIRAIEKVETGNLNVSIPIATNDEFALLSRSFNSMVIRIKELINKTIKIQRQEMRAEALYLQSQINPHFLYNTLDTIRWTARKNNDLEVSEYIEALSNLFKHLLIRDNEFTTFADELDNVKNYMLIQTRRFEDRITYEMDIDEDILPQYTLKLILQPIVENSIVHGLKNKTNNGRIIISGRIESGQVIISVADNGAGMEKSYLEQLMTDSSKKSLTINNIQTRIQLHFGSAYGLKIESEKNKYTKVTLTLPYLKSMPRWEDYSETFNS